MTHTYCSHSEKIFLDFFDEKRGYKKTRNRLIVQMVERAAHDGFVVGSTPTKPITKNITTKFIKTLCTYKMYAL